MGRKRFSPEQIIVKLREAEIIESKGLTQVEAAKKLGIAEQTLIRWRKEYGGLRVDQARRFKELDGKLQEFIAKQKIFFVGTGAAEGRVNMSPKGMDSLTRPPKSSPNVKLIKTIW